MIDDPRALTVRQPFADLIVAGWKPVENRTRPVPSTLPQWGRCTECGGRSVRARESWPRRTGHPCRAGGPHRFAPDGPFPFRLWIHAGKTWDRLPDGHPAMNAHMNLPTPLTCIACGWIGRIGSGEPPVPDCADVDRDGIHDLVDPRNRLGRTGVLLGSVTVTGCHHARDCVRDDDPQADHPKTVLCSRWAEPGVWHWTLDDPQPLAEPIPMRGALGLWRLPSDVAERLAA